MASAETAERASLAGLSLTIGGQDLHIDIDQPLASRGAITLESTIESVEAAADGDEIALRGAQLDGQMLGAPSYEMRGTMPVESLAVSQRGGPKTAMKRFSVEWRVAPGQPVAAGGLPTWPARASATMRVPTLEFRDRGEVIRLADASAVLDATIRDFDAFDANIDMPLSSLTARTRDGVAVSVKKRRVRAHGHRYEARRGVGHIRRCRRSPGPVLGWANLAHLELAAPGRRDPRR